MSASLKKIDSSNVSVMSATSSLDTVKSKTKSIFGRNKSQKPDKLFAGSINTSTLKKDIWQQSQIYDENKKFATIFLTTYDRQKQNIQLHIFNNASAEGLSRWLRVHRTGPMNSSLQVHSSFSSHSQN
ncbi:uncharacterized protein J8A68_002506 [[Candida] subhashii]|uniref:Uncharacterized protein n=1 Tax=[Candida] subhashii TaxID=561895 RepID=A0A8J5QP36_9ASCO|nr:uncharacterized protein J8A68_002506 [[Candida] subhashii]KAG7663945.1 hypothetical protein J8A68_002506 [[Candida] subhashii]